MLALQLQNILYRILHLDFFVIPCGELRMQDRFMGAWCRCRRRFLTKPKLETHSVCMAKCATPAENASAGRRSGVPISGWDGAATPLATAREC